MMHRDDDGYHCYCYSRTSILKYQSTSGMPWHACVRPVHGRGAASAAGCSFSCLCHACGGPNIQRGESRLWQSRATACASKVPPSCVQITIIYSKIYISFLSRSSASCCPQKYGSQASSFAICVETLRCEQRPSSRILYQRQLVFIRSLDTIVHAVAVTCLYHHDRHRAPSGRMSSEL